MVSRCATCNVKLRLKFLGVLGCEKREGMEFCGLNCAREIEFAKVKRTISNEELLPRIEAVQSSPCVHCGECSQIDFHSNWSAFCFFTYYSWREDIQLCCRKCGFSRKLADLFKTLLIGCWPVMGLIVGPGVIWMNVREMIWPNDASGASEKLTDYVRCKMAREAMQSP